MLLRKFCVIFSQVLFQSQIFLAIKISSLIVTELMAKLGTRFKGELSNN